MEQVIQTDEECVRGAWELVHQCDGSYMEYPMRTVLVQDVRGHWLDFAAWSAAAAFTRERLEEVRQLREEIAQQTELIDGTVPGPIIEDTEPPVRQCSILPESWRDGLQRTLSRLDSILADKTAGMKEGA